jgi:SHS2 domain-containing protein
MTTHSEAAPHIHEIAHTADAGFTVVAPTLAALFERAALGLMGLVVEPTGAVVRGERVVTVRADALEELLHRFLSDVLVLILAHGCVVWAVDVVHVDATSLDARLAVDDAPDALSSRPYQEVKAVTWHELAVAERDGGWSARVIVDI